MLHRSKTFLAAVILAVGAIGANAATVTVTEEDGTPGTSLYGLHEDTAATGVGLVGARVTASYSDGTTEDLVWSQTGRWSGGVTGANMTMSFERNDFVMTTTKILTSLLMDVGSGGSVFDVRPEGTEGSKWGYTYYEGATGMLSGIIGVTYSGIVSVLGDLNLPSIYTHMLVDYSGTSGGGVLGTTSFFTDIDDLAFDGDISYPDVQAVPLPAGLPLLLVGLFGLGAVRRRRV